MRGSQTEVFVRQPSRAVCSLISKLPLPGAREASPPSYSSMTRRSHNPSCLTDRKTEAEKTHLLLVTQQAGSGQSQGVSILHPSPTCVCRCDRALARKGLLGTGAPQATSTLVRTLASAAE